MTSRRRLLLALAICAAPVAICVPLVVSWRDRLPERLATHWSFSEVPDGFVDRDSFVSWWTFASVAAVVVGFAVVVLLRRGRRVAVAIVGGFSGFAAALGLLIAAPNLDLADPIDARLSWEVALLLPMMLGTAWLAWWAHGHARPVVIEATSPPSPDLPRLAPGEPAVFGDVTLVPWLTLLIFGLVGGLGVVTWALVSPWLGFELVVVGVLLALTTVSRVRASASVGLALSAGPFTYRVPIVEFAGARVVHGIRPLADYGGWGLRFAPRTVSVATRSGPGVELSRSNDRRVVITTDDPRRLAAVLNSLADERFGRARTAPDQ